MINRIKMIMVSNLCTLSMPQRRLVSKMSEFVVNTEPSASNSDPEAALPTNDGPELQRAVNTLQNSTDLTDKRFLRLLKVRRSI